MIRFRPIDTWDGPVSAHRPFSPFSSGWTETRELLLREVRALAPMGAPTPDVVIQLDVTEHAIRLDGALRADTRASTPRAVVSFDSVHGPLRYQCDRFDTSYRSSATAWQHNVRAIALGLEALRKVDRYGIAGSGEQYRGWTALPAAASADEPFTPDSAARYIMLHSTIVGGAGMREHYRSAARALHPDTGGTTEHFQRLQDAWRTIQEAPPL